jgi:hypothetical protein
MKLEERYQQTSDNVVECVLPIEMSSALAASKGITGRTVNRINEKDPSKSRLVVARTVSVNLDWTDATRKELVWWATHQFTANKGKGLMWSAEHENGDVNLGTIDMRVFIDSQKESARASASKEAQELRAQKAKIEKDFGVSLTELVALLAAGKVKIER